jgi:tetratricopeptide (TPR) repeat protein
VFEDGILNAAKGEPAKSIREFEYLANTYRQNPLVRYQLALATLLNAKKTQSPERDRSIEYAEAQLTDAVKLAPHFADAIILLSDLKIQKGVPAAAVGLLKPLTEEQPQITQAHYLLASAYLAQQQADQALAVYRQMEELFPKESKPSYLRGMILLAHGQPGEARKAFEKSLEISPEFLLAAERLVDLDLADRQYATAIDRAQKFIERDPKQAQAWTLMGKIYLAQQDFTRGEPDLLKAIELDPKLEPAYLLLTRLYVDSNQQERAIEKLTEFIDRNKDSGQKIAPALAQLGLIQQNLKHFNEAADAYEKLLASSPKYVLALNNLAFLYSDNLGQLDKAYDLAKRARDVDPSDPHVADTLGWILYKKGDYSAAIRLLQESAGRLTGDPDIQFHLGMAQYMLGAEEPARLALQQAVDIGTDFPGKEEARRRLGLLAINAQAGDTADVQNALESYLHEQPNDPAARLRLGELQEREGAVDQAVKTYQKIIEADQHFAPALRRLALLYSQRPSEDASFYDLATKARQAYPEDPDLARVLGILNYQRGFYQQSAELLKEAGTKQSNNAELFYYLGLASHQLQQWSECDSALKRAMNLDLSPKFAGQAKPALVDCSAQLEKAEGVQSYRSGDYQRSARLLKEAAINRKDDPELLYYLAQAYHQLRQLGECKETMQHALNLDLAPALANDAKHALSDCSETSSQ